MHYFLCFLLDAVLTAVANESQNRFYVGLLRHQRWGVTEVTGWKNRQFVCTLAGPLARLFTFVIALKITYITRCGRWRWDEVMFSLWNAKKQKKGPDWFNPSGTFFFLFLIRCTTWSPPSLNIWLKSSCQLIPHETLCKCFPEMLTRRLTGPWRGRYTADLVMPSGTLYVTLTDRTRTRCALRSACVSWWAITHPSSGSWRFYTPQTPCASDRYCALSSRFHLHPFIIFMTQLIFWYKDLIAARNLLRQWQIKETFRRESASLFLK